MLICILILICSLLATLTCIVYYRSKYWLYHNISDDAIKEIDIFKEKYSEKINTKLLKKSKQIKKYFSEKYDTLAKELEQDYNNACEEVKSELLEQLTLIDSTLKEHAEGVILKNVLTFSCSCSKDLIPVAIDFTKENTFTCPRCSSKYKIAINANPILIGREISDAQFANLLEERLNENKGKNN
jgi:uncharacterized Zn-finger protein